MRVLFAGGGTAGHINPAIAVANQLKSELPGTEILFVGTARGMEKTLVPNAGYDIKFIQVQGFKHKLSFENIKIVIKTVMSVRQSAKIIKEFKPDVVVGTGGYVSGPVVFAAAQKKIPTLIHEQNVFPGVTVKMLKKRADVVAISFDESRKYFSGAKKTVLTGNPLRGELFLKSKTAARAELKLDNRPFAVVMGGSLGAQNLNKAVIDYICENPDAYQVLLSVGERDYDRAMEQLKEKKFDVSAHPNIQIVKYIFNSETVLPAADLLVIRGGAISISEACALGKPSVIVPSPNVANNHQEYNARAMEKQGASVMVLDSQLEQGVLSAVLNELKDDAERLNRMGKAAAAIGIKDSAEQLCAIIKDIAAL